MGCTCVPQASWLSASVVIRGAVAFALSILSAQSIWLHLGIKRNFQRFPSWANPRQQNVVFQESRNVRMSRQSFAVMGGHGGLLVKRVLTSIHSHGDPWMRGWYPDCLCHPWASGLWVREQSSVRSGTGSPPGASMGPAGDKGRLYAPAWPLRGPLCSLGSPGRTANPGIK